MFGRKYRIEAERLQSELYNTQKKLNDTQNELSKQSYSLQSARLEIDRLNKSLLIAQNELTEQSRLLDTANQELNRLTNSTDLADSYSELLKRAESSSNRLDKALKENERLKRLETEFRDPDYNEYLKTMSLIEEDSYKDISSSDEYMELYDKQRDESKYLVKSKQAYRCDTVWKVNGSKAEGQKMVRDTAKVAIMVFDTIVDRACTYVKYGNFDKWRAKVIKAHATINRLMKVNSIEITDEYLESKLKELEITFKFQQIKQEEREKTKEIKRKALEEKREKEKLEREQAEIERLLKIEEEKQRAQAEANNIIQIEVAKTKQALSMLDKKGKEAEELEARIKELEAQLNRENTTNELVERLADLEAKKEVLQSGFVYVISNYGAFGEDVFKIGVTRRVDPLERINELGNASVPFKFNVHTIIPSEEAFKLEYNIHKALKSYRVNLVNNRKEFFKISMDKLVNMLNELVPGVLFNREVTEEQYLESARIRNNPEEFEKWLRQIEGKYDSDTEEELQISLMGVIDTSVLSNNSDYQITEQYENIYKQISEWVDGLSSKAVLRVTKYYISIYMQIDYSMKKLCTFYKNGDGSKIFSFSIQGYNGPETKGSRASIPIELFNESNYSEIILGKATEIDNELTDLLDITGIGE